jgi:hypothetical protein
MTFAAYARSKPPSSSETAPRVHRRADGTVHESKQAAFAPGIVSQVIGSHGHLLNASVRSEMESGFGQDFSSVRIHTDAKAAKSARGLHADAYAVGQHVVFADRQYRPGTAEGRRLIAHELSHVAAQPSQPNLGQPLRIDPPSSPAESAAIATADSVMGRTGQGAAEVNANVSAHDSPSQVFRQLSDESGPQSTGNALDAFTAEQRQFLAEFGVPLEQISDPEVAARLSVALENLKLAQQVAAGDPNIETANLRGATANFQRMSDDRLQEMWSEIIDQEASVRIGRRFDLATGELRLDFEFQDQHGNLVESSITQSGPRAVLEQAPIPSTPIVVEEEATFGYEPTPPASETGTAAPLASQPISEQKEGFGEFVKGGIYGDYGESSSFSAIAGQTVIGFVPIVGQIADIRDLSAALRDVVNGRDGGWINVGIAAIGFIPGLDFLKGGARIGKQSAKETAQAAAKSRRFLKLVGRSGREAFGETRFTGLIRNRPLSELSHNEIFEAFRTTAYRPNDHAIQRLLSRNTKKDVMTGSDQSQRLANLGIASLADVERVLNNGVVYEAGGGRLAIVLNDAMAIVEPSTMTLETLSPLTSSIIRHR